MAKGRSVALIGTDGSGKSSVARGLVEAANGPARVVYMGLNASRANTVLSLSRVADRLVRHEDSGFRGERRDDRGRLWAALRVTYWIAEEILRFATVAWYRWRGELVVMDRHFRFDHVLGDARHDRLSDRIHVAFLRRFSPEPDLVVFLDVPVTVARSRSGEGSERYHERRVAAYRLYAQTHPKVRRVDADRPLELVVDEVVGLVGPP